MILKKVLIPIFVTTASVVLNACNPSSQYSSNTKISSVDSARLTAIEDNLSFNKIDSVFFKINEEAQTDRYQFNKLYRLKILDIKARAYQRIKKYQSALDVANAIISESEHERDEFNPAFVAGNFMKGDIYFELGNYQIAYKYYYLGRESSIDHSNLCLHAQYDYRISILLYRQGKYLESINNFKSAHQNYSNCKNDFPARYRKQEIAGNIGLCFYKLQLYDSSLVYFNKALKEVGDINPLNSVQQKYIDVALGVISGNMGKVYMDMQKPELAIPLLEKNIQINSHPEHDNLDAITSIIALAKHYYSKKEYNKFLETINISNSFVNVPKIREQLQYIYELKSNYYTDIGQYNLALQNFKEYTHIKDSLANIRQKIADSDIQLSIESLEKENKIGKLIDENHRRNYYIYITISVVLALILLIITISVFLRYANRKNKELRDSHEEIIQQKELLKSANDEILYNLEVLKQRDIEKNKILSIVAHDLRNPNNSIISIVQTLKDERTFTNEELNLLNLIETSANSNNDLIQEILYFAKPGQFDTNSDLKIVNCRDLLKQTISLNSYKAAQKNIEIILGEIDPRLNVEIHVEKIRRAISNVIINAIKFSNHHKKINIYTTNTLELINIHIKDNGIGIPDRIKSAIFISDPIIRRLGTDGEASFGLGLAIVKQIVEEHNGKISFISNAFGTEFTITLPLTNKSLI